jgi:hypothetical protein
MLFSISVSFTNKHVNHTVIFELKKLKKKRKKRMNTRVSGIIFIRYALIQNISEPNNFEIFDSKKTTVKGPKLNSQKST